MLTPLTNRPYDVIHLIVKTTLEGITVLFFAAMSCFNDKWAEYAKYYHYKFNCNANTLKEFPNEIIHLCFNSVHPQKMVEVPIPTASSNPNFKIREDVEKSKETTGFCMGMSIDYMRRVKESKKPFWETINEVGKKFENGATKKGYRFQKTMRYYEPEDDYIHKKNGWYEELSQKIHEYPKEDWIDEYSKRITTAILKMASKKPTCLDINFKTKYYSHDFPTNDLDLLPDGDYLLSEIDNTKPGHMVCLFKRKEGIAIFDPNHGTLYFNTTKRAFEFLKHSSKRLYKEVPAFILSVCTNKDN